LTQVKAILKMIVRREWIKSEMHKFEKTASDPNRLFGSSLKLLEEEKFRK
jgi:Microtubule associated protein (MAP65/ASE1 family)